MSGAIAGTVLRHIEQESGLYLFLEGLRSDARLISMSA